MVKPTNRKPLYPVAKKKNNRNGTAQKRSPNISAEKKSVVISAPEKAKDDFDGNRTRTTTGKRTRTVTGKRTRTATTVADSAKSTVSIKGNFVRASRLSQLQAAPIPPVVAHPTPSPRYDIDAWLYI